MQKRIAAEKDAICTTPGRCGTYAVRVAKLELALSAMLRIYDFGDTHNDCVADAARKVLRGDA